MKTKLTLLFLLITTLTFAQYGYPYVDDGFGIGLGYNLTPVVGKEIHPLEVSFRYRINGEHMLQLYVPLFKQTNSFTSEGANGELVKTSLDTKKRLFGVGFDYDYALYNYEALDFVIGARFEYSLCKERSDLTNAQLLADGNSGTGGMNRDDIFREKKTRNVVVSPNAGFRLRMNRVYVDAKFLLSMLSYRGDLEKQTETLRNATSNEVTNTKYTLESISNKFKLKPAVVISTSYFF